MDIQDEDDAEEADENSGVDKDVEDEFGYIKEDLGDSDLDDQMAGVNSLEDADSDEFGPEDDGGEIDPDMEDLGYADL